MKYIDTHKHARTRIFDNDVKLYALVKLYKSQKYLKTFLVVIFFSKVKQQFDYFTHF